MANLITSIFGTHSEREVKKIIPIADKVLAYDEEYSKLSEAELRGKTNEFKQRYENGESLDMLLPEAFATIREASYRVLGMKPYKVQVIGGIVLHQGRIAEMKTGEGKTLVATMPTYLNALTGNGVHVVTVNDYLAKRDSEWMGKVYRYLGLTVGLIIHDINPRDRKKMYDCDIVYGTNNEFGFDYLRDNMVVSKNQLSQRGYNFAIVDEVDSILIDEARTPLIISGRGSASSDMYQKADSFAKTLKKYVVVETDDKEDMDEIAGDSDYIVDEKAKSAVLTANGVRKAEKYFGVENLSDPDNFELQHYINNAIKAHGTFFRDQQYVVMDGEVVIVDDFTGRLMPGRRYSDGIHQAIEAKEGVKIANENKTLATITFQNYFRMYSKLSGMTGTAITEEDEFRSIYNLDVIQIPTNKPVQRIDENDSVYKTQKGKYTAVLKTVIEAHDRGQPVLIGTVSVDKSEYLSKIFTRAGIKHNVLNAKNHMREAEIVAQAGRKGAVTIATNMAGRGTDILLGGNAEYLAKQEMRKSGYPEELIEASTAYDETTDEIILEARKKFADLKKSFEAKIAPEAQEVRDLGGLFIIGTERHESRRIDHQLQGRSGRQGDPGRAKFFLALDDDLIRIFGGDKVTQKMDSFGIDENMEITNRLLTSIIETSQKKLEGLHFSARKATLDYDDVMNEQRTITYNQRRAVIDGNDMHETVIKMIEKVSERVVSPFALDGTVPESEQYSLGMKIQDLFGELPIVEQLKDKNSDVSDEDEIVESLKSQALTVLEEKEQNIPKEVFREIERAVILRNVDLKWQDHIDAMDSLSTAVRMRSIAQHDPVIEYKNEGGEMFEEMNFAIQNDTVKTLMTAQFTEEKRVEVKQVSNPTTEGRKAEPVAAPAKNTPVPGADVGGKSMPVKSEKAVGRNDPCPCGSGKKYKNCCGKN